MSMTNYSTQQIAEITGKSAETVRNWIRDGKLKARKPTGCRDYVVKKQDFDMFWYGEPQVDGVGEMHNGN